MAYKLAVIGILLLLTSCAGDPRNQADADNSRVLAAELAADQQQERQFAADREALAMAQRQTTAADRAAAVVLVVRFASWAGVLVIGSAAVAASWGMIGAGRAVAKTAELRGSLITLDKATRTFPLLMQYSGRGFYTLTNCNTGQVIKLDTRQPGDRQQIAILGAVLTAGVIAGEARKAHDSAAVVLARPEVITLAGGQDD